MNIALIVVAALGAIYGTAGFTVWNHNRGKIDMLLRTLDWRRLYIEFLEERFSDQHRLRMVRRAWRDEMERIERLRHEQPVR